MTGEGVPYLGSKISLISKSEIRYEGILYTIDGKDSTLALARVKSFGTEDRPTERPVSARDEIYEYIIFRANDIKDLTVCNAPKQTPIGLASDPAIVHHSGLIPQFVSSLTHSVQNTLYKDSDKSREMKFDASTQVSNSQDLKFQNRRGRNQNSKFSRRYPQGGRRRNNSYNQKTESTAPSERADSNKQRPQQPRQQRPRERADSNSQRRNSFPREKKLDRDAGVSKQARPKPFRTNRGPPNPPRPQRTVKFDNSFDFEEANAKFMELELKDSQKNVVAKVTEKVDVPKDEKELTDVMKPATSMVEENEKTGKVNPSEDPNEKTAEKEKSTEERIDKEKVNKEPVEKVSKEPIEKAAENEKTSVDSIKKVAEKETPSEEHLEKAVEKVSEDNVKMALEKGNEDSSQKSAEKDVIEEPCQKVLPKDSEKADQTAQATTTESKTVKNQEDAKKPSRKGQYLPLYDKKKSFYDRVSHFTVQIPNADDWKREREMNIETFGVPRIQRAYRGRVWVQRGRGQSRFRGANNGPRNTREDNRDTQHINTPRGGYRGARHPANRYPNYGRQNFSPQPYRRPQQSYQFPQRNYRDENDYTRFYFSPSRGPRFPRFQRPEYKTESMEFRSPQPRRYRPNYNGPRMSRQSVLSSSIGPSARAKTPETPKRFTKANKEAAAHELAKATKNGIVNNGAIHKTEGAVSSTPKPKSARASKEGRRTPKAKKENPEKPSPKKVSKSKTTEKAEVPEKKTVSILPGIELMPHDSKDIKSKSPEIAKVPEEQQKLETKSSTEKMLVPPEIFNTSEVDSSQSTAVDIQTMIEKFEQSIKKESTDCQKSCGDSDKQTEPKDPEILKDAPKEQREPRKTQLET